MMDLKPIPPFYGVYLLRPFHREKHPNSFYIGSTPNPRRRLAQHNGRHGANLTSRTSLRPWNMVCLVGGFPSNIAALQFEWTWQNPHLTRRILPTQRITPADLQVSISKRTGRPRKRLARPRMSLCERLLNLHLLLRVPSFSRWSLQVRFLDREVWRVWREEVLPNPAIDKPGLGSLEGTDFVLDFSGPLPEGETEQPPEKPAPQRKRRRKGDVSSTGGVAQMVAPVQATELAENGIEGVDATYKRYKSSLEKARFVLGEAEAVSCAVCQKPVDTLKPAMAMLCSSNDCRSVSHVSCLAERFLDQEREKQTLTPPPLLPKRGTCPSCDKALLWEDLTRELTLRLRGQKKVDELLKPPRQRKASTKRATKKMPSQVIALDSDIDEELEEVDIAVIEKRDEDEEDDFGTESEDEFETLAGEVVDEPLRHEAGDDDASSVTSVEPPSQSSKAKSSQLRRPVFRIPNGAKAVIDDSEGEAS